MSQKQLHVKTRDLRRALGTGSLEVVRLHEHRLNELEAWAQRGFWGRVKWLVLGR